MFFSISSKFIRRCNQLSTKEDKAREERLILQLSQLEGRMRAMDRILRGIALSCKRTIEEISIGAALSNRAKNAVVMTSVKKAIVKEREQEAFENFFKTRLVITNEKTIGLSTKEVRDYYSAMMDCDIPSKVVLACMRRMGHNTGPINTYGVKDNDDQYRTTYRGFKALAPRDSKHMAEVVRGWEERKPMAPGYNMREAEFVNLELAARALDKYHHAVEEVLNPDNDPDIEEAAELMDISYTDDIQL